jgi:anti-sigma B factor antagonist
MDELTIKTEFIEKSLPVVLVKLHGYIDQTNCDQLQKILDNLFIGGHYYVVFDFNDLVYMSSAGWGVFVGDVKRFRENGGDLKLTKLTSDMYETYQMLEFYHILEEYSTIEDALAAYGITNKNKVRQAPSQQTTMENDYREETIEENFVKDEYTDKIDLDEIKIDKMNGDIDVNEQLNTEDNTFDEDSDLIDIITSSNEMNDDFDIGSKYNIARLPIQEKIRKLVAQFPLISLREIKKMLKSEEFGREKTGYFKLYRLLKSLNLESRKKRYRFYRSC